MATDSSEELAQDTETSSVKAGSGGEMKRALKLPKPKMRKRNLLYAVLIIVVLVGGWQVVRKELRIGEKVYAQAAGHKIYREDVKDLIGNTKGVSDRQAATVLADKYLTEAMAKDAKVSVSDQDLVNEYGKEINTQKTQQKLYYQRKVNQLYFKKLGAYTRGIYKGKYLIANFSRNIPHPSPLMAEEKSANPNLGNPKAIAADKKYAENLLTKLYNQITDGKITFDQAIEAEQQDPQVGLKAYPTQPHSGSFDTSKGYGSLLTADVTAKKIPTIQAGTTTKPFLAATSSGATDNNSTLGSYYLVVRMDESRGGVNMSFDQYLQESKQKLGYKINV